MRVKDAVGRFGEQQAAAHLEAAGFTLLARNWRCPAGELDIIARDGDQLVFVEVKTRSSLAFGSPAEAVGRAKTAQVRQLAARWIASTSTARQCTWSSARFDVVTVLRSRSGNGVQIDHLRGAF